jgi:hypothetical protein
MGVFIDAYARAIDLLTTMRRGKRPAPDDYAAFFRLFYGEAERRLEAGEYPPFYFVQAACRAAGVSYERGTQWVDGFLYWRDHNFRPGNAAPDGLKEAAVAEGEWAGCADPTPMLTLLQRISSNRKARLFACGLGRALWRYLVDGRSRRVVEVAERYADELATEGELLAAEVAANSAARGAASRAILWSASRHAWLAAGMTVVCIRQAATDYISRDWSERVMGQSTDLLRDVFGNPFRPVAVEPAWLTWNGGTVRQVAQAIYDDHAYDHLPVLADALEDAGCADQSILSHCRGEGPHVRGCWVVDLILGKM